MSGGTFEITKARCKIESVTFAKAKPKGPNDNGAGVKKLKLWIDAAEDGLMKRIVPLFAGVVDEHTAHRVASEGGPGFEVRSKRKLGLSNVKVHDPQGDVLFESPTARVERPKLVIGKEGKTAWLVLDVEMAIPKKALSIVDDYFKADVLASVANAQMDLEDQAAEKVTKAKAKNGERKGRKGGVQWAERQSGA